ncbi:type II toxin-antitoxin system RelE/ParE family toxin [Pigmentiphaga sp.]|uniref:type II toxin-antitoxin system RelE/ParE family toxin n=1 Tax=Pigmentiphaga sp. TaxID=1977564 RepID=UPI00128DE2CB|nr:type II toxin-antitoxin system RelE/ParE family toxin [Pigmentiphaga sp.]MPS25584.1 peptidase [Alcaligenaceae bacterium SAGV5]MPS54216.1 peptidase [Alcaligenaceae bacterium SAGV3]MPT55700.1 peptidase [Alcaligenaceae bacterium]
MIKSFRHKGIQLFFETGSKAKIVVKHAATSEADMSAPGWNLHQLSGKNPKGQSVAGHWAVSVSGNWRLTFYFENGDAVLVDYQDYH